MLHSHLEMLKFWKTVIIKKTTLSYSVTVISSRRVSFSLSCSVLPLLWSSSAHPLLRLLKVLHMKPAQKAPTLGGLFLHLLKIILDGVFFLCIKNVFVGQFCSCTSLLPPLPLLWLVSRSLMSTIPTRINLPQTHLKIRFLTGSDTRQFVYSDKCFTFGSLS